MNYTKGKWTINKSSPTDVYAINNGSHFVAECGNPYLPNGEDLANAHLISAAPDMYEAIKMAINELTEIQGDWASVSDTYVPSWVNLIRNALSPLHQALAKAEGEK